VADMSVMEAVKLNTGRRLSWKSKARLGFVELNEIVVRLVALLEGLCKLK
jgi:hypothetical protein